MYLNFSLIWQYSRGYSEVSCCLSEIICSTQIVVYEQETFEWHPFGKYWDNHGKQT